jgi:hypothetical protein
MIHFVCWLAKRTVILIPKQKENLYTFEYYAQLGKYQMLCNLYTYQGFSYYNPPRKIIATNVRCNGAVGSINGALHLLDAVFRTQV